MDAYNPDGKCMRLFLSTKPCTYQSVPTKVTSSISYTASLVSLTDFLFFQIISVRPFMTFTNRIGEDIYIKLNSADEPKVLHAYDSRVSFVFHPSGRDELQVSCGMLQNFHH